MSGIIGIWGRPFIDLERRLDLAPLGEIHEEICLGLTRVPVDYTGGSHRSMGIVPPSLAGEPWIDYGEVIRGMSREELLRFRDLSDDPGAIDVDRAGEIELGEEREIALSRRQMIYLKVRYKVYFPWKAYYELIPNRYWDEKSSAAGKSFTREARAIFPKTVAYLKALPFVEIGRANIMGLESNDFGTVHRDAEPAPNVGAASGPHTPTAGYSPADGTDACHFITLCPAGDKRVFLWDEERREKAYAPSRAYWFNDRDYHGVDPDPFFRYSIRVDGVFEKGFLEAVEREAREAAR